MRYAPLGIAAVVLTVLTSSGPVYSAGGERFDTFDGPTSTLDMSFRLYVGGIPFGQAVMSSVIQGEEYRANSFLETEGIVNRFWESKIEAASSGTVGERNVLPARYDNFTIRRGRRREVTIGFDPEGPATLFAEPEYRYDDDDLPVTAVETRNSLDPLSAVVFLVNSYRLNQENPCQVTAPVYDGRRRYDVAFTHVRDDDITMDNGLYSGPVMVCEINYIQVAGDEQAIVENGQEIPRIFGWVAAMRSKSDPDRHYMLPLRLWSDTYVGTVVAVLTSIKLDGAEVAASDWAGIPPKL